jgi:hypothetical protein
MFSPNFPQTFSRPDQKPGSLVPMAILNDSYELILASFTAISAGVYTSDQSIPRHIHVLNNSVSISETVKAKEKLCMKATNQPNQFP